MKFPDMVSTMTIGTDNLQQNTNDITQLYYAF